VDPSEEILTRLKIDDEALDHHKDEITSRLESAARSLTSRARNPLSQQKMFGINQCLHLAGTLVLLEGNAQALRQVLQDLSPPRKTKASPESDATTFLSVAMLYHLLTKYLPEHVGAGVHYDAIWEALGSVNWIVGKNDMDLLGIKRPRSGGTSRRGR
jgi:hypothetical protein